MGDAHGIEGFLLLSLRSDEGDTASSGLSEVQQTRSEVRDSIGVQDGGRCETTMGWKV